MPRLAITDLEKELRQGKVRPVYAIVGPEGYLAQSALQTIKANLIKGDALAVTQLSGREARVEAVFSTLKTVSLLGDRPICILRDGEAIPKETLEALTAYLEKPIEAATLIVVAEKLDGRSRFLKLAEQQGAVIDCKQLYQNQIAPWINIEAKRQGRQFSMEAARFLAEMVGNDLGQVVQAIERVILYVGERRTVEVRDVEEAVAETHQHTIFELTDAVGMRRLPRALSLLTNVLESGESPVLVLNMLARHVRLLSKAKEVAGRLGSSHDIASYLGVNPYFAKNYLEQSRQFSKSELRSFFGVLARCDRELKSSRVPKVRVIEKALFAIAQPAGKGAAAKKTPPR